MHGSYRKMIRESIHESQKCQRNWDLEQSIDDKDRELIIEAATNSPSKQNLNYFKLHVIEDRDMIEAIHDNTKGSDLSIKTSIKIKHLKLDLKMVELIMKKVMVKENGILILKY